MTDALQRIVARVGQLGIHLPSQMLWLLERRVRERRLALGEMDPGRYADLLQAPGGAQELLQLVEAVRVGQTRFFRFLDQLRALRRVALPELMARHTTGPLRLWSAGCATGEEAFTVAMVVEDWLRSQELQLPWELLATDLSGQALTTARAACYSAQAVEPIPPALRKRYLITPGAGQTLFQVQPELYRRVQFREHDLVASPCPGAMDLIFCRNVLIYLQRQVRQDVATRLVAALTPHGFLFLGSGEVLNEIPDGCELLRTPDGLIYQRRPHHQEPKLAAGGRSLEAAVATGSGASVSGSSPVITLRGSYDESELTRVLRPALHTGAVLELDGATYLAPGCARVIRRLADSLGTGHLVLLASQPGVVRWITRHRGLLGDLRQLSSLAQVGDQ